MSDAFNNIMGQRANRITKSIYNVSKGSKFQEPTYNTYHDVNKLPAPIFTEMSHFFSVYKNLEGKETVVDELRDAEEAHEVIQKCLNAYIEKFCR